MNILRKIIRLDRVGSTNSYASQLLAGEGFIDGTVIVARNQFAGRGQNENRWYSEPGKNLTLTLCLRPAFLSPGRQFLLSKTVALGVLDFVRILCDSQHSAAGSQQSPVTRHESRIKWPNDILAGDRKVGGILIEHRILGDRLEATLAGIGVNLNQAVFDTELPNPVSLFQLTGRETDPGEALDLLLGCLDERYALLKSGETATIDRDYNMNLLGFEEWRDFIVSGNRVRGMIRGVDEFGRLLLDRDNGSREAYGHGEVVFVLRGGE